MVNRGALRRIATDLFALTNGILGSAVHSSLEGYVEWQRDREDVYGPFQYPEPFNGIGGQRCAVLFCGLNPGISEVVRGEVIPRRGEVDAAAYSSFYEQRFAHRDADDELITVDGRAESLEHYRFYERHYVRAVSRDPRNSGFGRNAAYVDAIPFKSRSQGDVRVDAASAMHEIRNRLEELVDAYDPGLVVFCHSSLKDWFPPVGMADGGGLSQQVSLKGPAVYRTTIGDSAFFAQYLYHKGYNRGFAPGRQIQYYRDAAAAAAPYLL